MWPPSDCAQIAHRQKKRRPPHKVAGVGEAIIRGRAQALSTWRPIAPISTCAAGAKLRWETEDVLNSAGPARPPRRMWLVRRVPGWTRRRDQLSAVARRCGFGSPGRFAINYSAAFGEPLLQPCGETAFGQ
jgi:hypothetical protein